MLFRNVILFASLMVISCGKNIDRTNEVRLNTQLTIPAGLNTLETHFFFIRNIPTYYDENLIKFGIQEQRVTKITGSSVRLNAAFSAINLGFISRISIFAVSRTDQNLKKEMFYLDDVNLNPGTELQLLTSISDIKNIIDDGKFDLELRLNFRTPPPTSVLLDIEMGYLIYE